MYYDIKEIPCQRSDNGKKLFLTKTVSQATRSGMHILLLHGLTMTQHVWDVEWKDYSVTRFLASKGYTVWRLDAGGFGRSERYECGWDCDTDNAVLDTIEAIEAMRKEMGIEDLKTDIMGWSWGTMVGSRTAARRPDMVRRLILAAPVTGHTFEPFEEGTWPNDKAPIDYGWAARLFRYQISGGDGISNFKNPILEDDIDFNITEAPVVGMEFRNIVKYDMTDARPLGSTVEIYYNADKWLIDGPSIPCPTLLIAGTDDNYNTPELMAELLETLPEGSERVVLWGAGHGMFFEKDYYHDFQNNVLAFLTKEL